VQYYITIDHLFTQNCHFSVTHAFAKFKLTPLRRKLLRNFLLRLRPKKLTFWSILVISLIVKAVLQNSIQSLAGALSESRWFAPRVSLVRYQSLAGSLPESRCTGAFSESRWFAPRVSLVRSLSIAGSLPESRWFAPRVSLHWRVLRISLVCSLSLAGSLPESRWFTPRVSLVRSQRLAGALLARYTHHAEGLVDPNRLK
jgi:hypothetical protein